MSTKNAAFWSGFATGVWACVVPIVLFNLPESYKTTKIRMGLKELKEQGILTAKLPSLDNEDC
ncbi:MAG: hypothetical protein CMP20_01865 [Rickettsiales bacterium]|nr:hypothetical protein [Rickettsiales bacterium]